MWEPSSASWSYAPKGPGLNWCLAASGNLPPSWLKCCRIGLTFMLLRFDIPRYGKSNATRCDLNRFWQLIPVVSVSSKCSVVIPSSNQRSPSPSCIFALYCRTWKHNRGQGGTQNQRYMTTRYEEDTLCECPPMELECDIPYSIGASLTKRGSWIPPVHTVLYSVPKHPV